MLLISSIIFKSLMNQSNFVISIHINSCQITDESVNHCQSLMNQSLSINHCHINSCQITDGSINHCQSTLFHFHE